MLLSKDFGSLRASNCLTLRILPGITFGFLGPSSTGKTTTIHLLLSLLLLANVGLLLGALARIQRSRLILS